MAGPPHFTRWYTFCASAWIQTCAGLFYCFGVYAPAIKSTFGLDQTQVQTLGAALMFGAYLAPPGGLLYERLAHHPLGPRLVLWLGVALGLVGYGILYVATAHASAATANVLAAAAIGSSTPLPRPDIGSSSTMLWNCTSSGSSSSIAVAAGNGSGCQQRLPGSSATQGTAVALESGPAAANMLLLMLALVMAGCSGNLMDTGALVTNVRNFPSDRGPVIGVLKALLGVGPSLFTTAYHAFLAPQAVAFIALLAVAPVVIVGLPSVAVNLVPNTNTTSSAGSSSSNKRRFAVAYALVGVLAVWQLLGSLLPGSRSGRAPVVFLAGACLLLLGIMSVGFMGGEGLWHKGSDRKEQAEEELTGLLPPPEHEAHARVYEAKASTLLATALDAEGARGRGLFQTAAFHRSSSNEAIAGQTPQHRVDQEGRSSGSGSRTPQHRVEQGVWSSGSGSSSSGMDTLRDCYSSTEFWLVFLVFAIGVGSGLAFTNNVPELVAALAGDPSSTSSGSGEVANQERGASAAVALVSLFSVGSCFGRLLFGYIPEWAMVTKGIPRPVHLIAISALMCLVNVILGLTTAVAPLYPITLIYGVGFGGLWCVVPAVASDVFGLQHFASVYTTLILAPALGCWLLAAQLAGRLYDAMSGGSSSRNSWQQWAAATAGAAAAAEVGSGSGSSSWGQGLVAVEQLAGPGSAALMSSRKLVAAAKRGTAGYMQQGSPSSDLWNHTSGCNHLVKGLVLAPLTPPWYQLLRQGLQDLLVSSFCSLATEVQIGFGREGSMDKARVGPLWALGVDRLGSSGSNCQTATGVAELAGVFPGGAGAPVDAPLGASEHAAGLGWGSEGSAAAAVAAVGGLGGDGPACLGPECFRLTFFILAILCGLAAVAAAQLMRRTQPCYSRIIHGLLQQPSSP